MAADRIPEEYIKIAEQVFADVDFAKQLEQGVPYAQVWLEFGLKKGPDGRISVPPAAIQSLCEEAKKDLTIFNILKGFAGAEISAGKKLPADLANLIGSFLLGDFRPPKKHSPSFLRNYLIFRMGNGLANKADLKPGKNRVRAPNRGLDPSASEVINKVLAARNLDPPGSESIERIMRDKKQKKIFRSIEAKRYGPMFD